MKVNVKLKSLMGKMDKIRKHCNIESQKSDELSSKWYKEHPTPEAENVTANYVHNSEFFDMMIKGFPEVEYRYGKLYHILEPYESLDVDKSATIEMDSDLYQFYLKL